LTVRSALGTFAGGQFELLGFWPEPDPDTVPWHWISDFLEARGVENNSFCRRSRASRDGWR
jgi:hypothetical protein